MFASLKEEKRAADLSRARRIFLLVIISMGSSIIYTPAYLKFVFYNELMAALHITNEQVGTLLSAYAITATICYLPSGIVADKVRAEGYDILDVDSVIAAQAPKLSPYREAMRENLAAAMGIAVENVGVKATTTEHLGFEGREEGISATAVCILFRRSDEQRS